MHGPVAGQGILELKIFKGSPTPYNVKMIQNQFTQQVQHLSNNFCDSGLGTPSSLNDTKYAQGSTHRRSTENNIVSTTPNGKISSLAMGKLSNTSSNHNIDSSKIGQSMKSYLNSSSSTSSSTSKWKSSVSGKLVFVYSTIFNCCRK